MESFAFPLGATLVDGGVNFSLFSRNAAEVVLYLYDGPRDAAPSRTIPLHRSMRHVWHVFVPGVGPGQLYGYKVGGTYDPRRGLRFNPQKLLVDPYAKALSHKIRHADDRLFAYVRKPGGDDLTPDPRPNDDLIPKSVVVADDFDWQGVERPRRPTHELMIYETHVKGFTAHASSGVSRPGTYAGFIERIPHLLGLGINAVELLPIQECCDEEHLLQSGLTNYWGYSTLGFFAPDARFASDRTPGAAVREFKTLVRELHRAGIEVILDIVFNHTCEGNHLGPTYSFKGIDHSTYYKLQASNPRFNWDCTGCGNTFDAGKPQGYRFIMDCLRYWTSEFQVDGFRFDLAVTLARTHETFDQHAPFFVAVAQDPALQHVKLIAEPWDLGYGGYQLGAFPVEFMEWNGRYRDTVRRFAKGDGGQRGLMGYALTGSSDLFAHNGRTPCQSVNYITSHDGFTLADWTAYNEKHNDANLEHNRDGSDENWSHNHGAEGPTNDPEVALRRLRTQKNAIAILMMSFGVPMIAAGDEFGKTQRGNNNAYCQDNPLTWLDFRLQERNDELFEFFRRIIALRRSLPYFQRRHVDYENAGGFAGMPDIRWFDAESKAPDWGLPDARFLAMLVEGRHRPGRADTGERDVLVILNMEERNVLFTPPTPFNGDVWGRVVDTSRAAPDDVVDESLGETYTSEPVDVPKHTVIVAISRHRPAQP